MLFFGKKALQEAEEQDRKAEKIKAITNKKIQHAEDSATSLHALLKANGIALRIYVAKGGDRHGREHI